VNGDNELLALLAILAERSGKSLPELLKANSRELGALLQTPPPPDGRWQDDIIVDLVSPETSVLDLGCGEGELLARLRKEKKVRGQGVELDGEACLACVERGVPVIQSDVDKGLAGYPDSSFSIAILEETLQTLRRPDQVLMELVRVGHRGIVSFPNFGHWRIRLDLALRGRMPASDRLPHHWFDTPNIHLFTVNDFIDRCDDLDILIDKAWVLADGAVRPLVPGDNLTAEEALFVVARPDDS
jgi:methionine biosynthesis protein MetW